MALFSSEVSDAVKRLAAKTYATPEERDELLGRIESVGSPGTELEFAL